MCSVQEEGVTAPEPKPKIAGRVCMKCTEPAVVVIRGSDPLCKPCFVGYCTHKFRASFGKSRVVRDGEGALVAFSGGLNSSAMLHLVQEGKSARANRKLRFQPSLVHIDDMIKILLAKYVPPLPMDAFIFISTRMRHSGWFRLQYPGEKYPLEPTDSRQNTGNSLPFCTMLRPYNFQPTRNKTTADYSSDSSSEEDSFVLNQSENRMENSDWCSCASCLPMPSKRECVCCTEIDEVVTTMGNIQCITLHESFSAVCLNREVLWTAMVCMKDVLHNQIEQPISNRAYRLAAYRQFTWWVHRKLGRGVRRVIPACTVLRIRTEFPEEDNNYVGFEEPDFYN